MRNLAATLTVATILAFTGSALAQGERPRDEHHPYPPHKQQQEYYNPQPQAALTATRIRLSGSGNGSARQSAIENDRELLARVNRGQVRTRDILIGRVDLNGDGRDEIFVYNEAAQYCQGNRCPFSVYQVVRNQPLRPLLRGYMTVNEIGVLNQYNRGWRDIVVYDQRGRQVVLTYNGNHYVQAGRGYGKNGRYHR